MDVRKEREPDAQRGWDVVEHLRRRLECPLPGRESQARFEPRLAHGRHFSPPPPDAKRGAVVMLLYRSQGDWRLPLTLRPRHLPHHPGQICLPGGAVEPGETNRAAALRELDEELGIGPAEVNLLGSLSPLYVFNSNFTVTPWLAVAPGRPAMRPDPREVAEVIEPSLDALADRSRWGRHREARGSLVFSAPHIRWQSHIIWGATSMMLGELIALVEEAGLTTG